MASSEAVPETKRIASLDLLRGLAAFAVMIPHFYMYRASSPLGSEVAAATAVEVFFVLSGYVLGPQIVLYAERRNFSTASTFLVRRWMRTVPTYLVALIAISILFRTLPGWDFVHYATYTQNLFYQSNRQDYFPVAWSLSVEEYYYIIFPFFLIVCCKLRSAVAKTPNYLFDVTIFIVLVTVCREVFGDLSHWGEGVRRVVAFRIDSIAYGFALYLVIGQKQIRWTPVRRGLAVLTVVIASLLMLRCNLMIADDNDALAKRLYPFASAAFGMSLIILFLGLNGLIAGKNRKKLCQYLGRISYPVYLFHLLVLLLIGTAISGKALAALVSYIVLTILVATGFHYGFERPILAMRPKYAGTGDRSSAKMLQMVH